MERKGNSREKERERERERYSASQIDKEMVFYASRSRNYSSLIVRS